MPLKAATHLDVFLGKLQLKTATVMLESPRDSAVIAHCNLVYMQIKGLVSSGALCTFPSRFRT